MRTMDEERWLTREIWWVWGKWRQGWEECEDKEKEVGDEEIIPKSLKKWKGVVELRETEGIISK